MSFSSVSFHVFVFVSVVDVDAAFVVAQLGRTGGRRWSMIIPRRPSKIQTQFRKGTWCHRPWYIGGKVSR